MILAGAFSDAVGKIHLIIVLYHTSVKSDVRMRTEVK